MVTSPITPRALKNEELTFYRDSLTNLLAQLYEGDEVAGIARSIERYIEAVAASANTAVVGMMTAESALVGVGQISYVPLLNGLECRLDVVVIDEHYRGAGLGHTLVESLLAEGRRRWPYEYVELTSAHHRVAAGELYSRMGFVQKDTRVYVKDCD